MPPVHIYQYLGDPTACQIPDIHLLSSANCPRRLDFQDVLHDGFAARYSKELLVTLLCIVGDCHPYRVLSAIAEAENGFLMEPK